jgi:hypothetical protein
MSISTTHECRGGSVHDRIFVVPYFGGIRESAMSTRIGTTDMCVKYSLDITLSERNVSGETSTIHRSIIGGWRKQSRDKTVKSREACVRTVGPAEGF